MIVKCTNCSKEFEKKKSEIKRTKNNFCSHSCSAIFNNKKLHGEGNQRGLTGKCFHCGENTKKNRKFCNSKCQGDYNWSEKLKIIESTQEVNISEFERVNRNYAKRYMIETVGHKCSICNKTKWLGNDIPLVLDHIDGDSENNKLDNFRLVCGNCNMILPTFAGRNKGTGKGRKYRRERYKDGKSF